MTLDEAKDLALVIGTADGGCPVCVDNLVVRLNARFPDFCWTATGDPPPPELPHGRG